MTTWKVGDKFTAGPNRYEIISVRSDYPNEVKVHNLDTGWSSKTFMIAEHNWIKVEEENNNMKTTITYNIERIYGGCKDWSVYRKGYLTYNEALTKAEEVAKDADKVRIVKVETIETVLQEYKLVLQPV